MGKAAAIGAKYQATKRVAARVVGFTGKVAFHKLFDWYAQEFAPRRDLHEEDAIDIMAAVAGGICGKRLRYRGPIAPDGPSSGVRSAWR